MTKEQSRDTPLSDLIQELIALKDLYWIREGDEHSRRVINLLNRTITALSVHSETASKQSAIGTTYRQVGWAQIELRATQGGMLYEVAGSVSDERTEHHTEPVYIAVVEAADRYLDKNVPSTNILKNDSKEK